jgi:hypothetical protein
MKTAKIVRVSDRKPELEEYVIVGWDKSPNYERRAALGESGYWDTWEDGDCDEPDYWYEETTDLKSEQDFITHFKEQGFELYKTEDLKPKLDSLETLNRDLNSCVNALTECANNHPEGATYINIMLVGIKGRLQKLNELLSTHKTQ